MNATYCARWLVHCRAMTSSKWRSAGGAQRLVDDGGEFREQTLRIVFELMKFVAMNYEWDEHERSGYRLLLEREQICLAALAQEEPITPAPLFGVLSA